ncbi:hypothetical protein CC1G_12505 [Coprinopsis cinerea okayama7|uniref:N-acetyltransferase domain-containing protein n=1 Tax=Coprinopsis cinerea (strain Okayama-7 / 130 / ATCC MYA-4618 / FGSC 9003) TaxID=240176 RepID=A8PAF0_COPC7|nr:hypothetical protein CC1G_12505 [Coprinopsis cinerea okayama7\|eukprot:XP_001839976.2 hypothetical protein CC1G_12505 [Coprinopsis cinerea okayama7\
MSMSAAPSIRIRLYEDRDEAKVHALFVDSQIEGVPGAPINDALRQHLTSPSSFLCLGLSTIGSSLLLNSYSSFLPSGLSLWLARLPIKSPGTALGVALTTVPALYWFLYRRHIRTVFNGYVKMSMDLDLKDIGKSYMGFRRDEKYSGGGTGAWRSRFWVAEVVDGPARGEIVGCVGLDALLNPDPEVLELRRMVVALPYRRQGIGHMLIRALVDHVKDSNAKLGSDPTGQGVICKRITLATTTFQKTAMKMYEKHGWKKEKVTVYMGSQTWSMGIISYGLGVQFMALEIK